MAEIRILRPGDEAALEAFLLPRVESSMFLIGNMRASGLIDGGKPYEGTYAAACEGDEVVSVVAHFWNGVLVFQAPVHLDALRQSAAQGSGRPVEGLIGPGVQVAAAKESLGILEGAVQLDETEYLYSLALEDLRVPDGLDSGRLRARHIEPGDLDLITEWRVAFSVQGLGEEDNPQLWEETRASLERSLDKGWTWLLEDGDQPVSTTSFNTAIAEAVQVGGVWTPSEFRRRGYGRAVVAASLVYARKDGAKTAILFTGVENIAAQRAYLALGFCQIGTYRLLLLREGVPG